MKKMIDELWDGEISPQDNPISDNQEYRELQHRQSQNKAELLEALSNEQKELLEKYCATEIELNGISEREAFTAGFKIAMRLAAEAFYEADNEQNNDRRDFPSLGGVSLHVDCMIEIEEREDL